MRRVVVTPTFVAGLGVVVAAVLASPMQTVFNYAAPNGANCRVISCEGKSQAGGQIASGPVHRLTTPGPAGTHPGSGKGSTSAKRAAGGGGGSGGGTVAASPELSYQTSRLADWGFAGTIEITFKPKFTHQRWQLRFSYPSARILRVRAGRYIRIGHDGPHTAVVASVNPPTHGKFLRLVRVSIEVAGRPGPPGRCSFNGRGCHFGGRHAGQRGPGGAQGHRVGRGGHRPRRARRHKPASALS